MVSVSQQATFTEVADEVKKAAEWLAGLGFKLPSTRLGQYQRIIDDVNHAHVSGTLHEVFARVGVPEVLNAFFEANEWQAIYRQFHSNESDPLRERLREFVKGPVLAADEKPGASSNRPRNIGFELRTAARFVAAGYEFDPRSPADLRLSDGDMEIFVECKRPQASHSVHANIKDALRQLRKRYRSENSRGVIALSTSKAVNPESLLLVAASSAGMNAELTRRMNDFMAEHEHRWRRPRDDRTVGALVEFRCMAEVKKSNSYSTAAQVGLHSIRTGDHPNAALVRSIHDRLAANGE